MQRARGERWLLAPSSCPGPSITTSQTLHLTCTISKSLAQVLLPCSLLNNTTLIFHAKPLGKPGSWRAHMETPGWHRECFALHFLYHLARWQGRQPEPLWVPITLCSRWAAALTSPVTHSPCPWLAAANPPGVGGTCSHSVREWEGGGHLWAASPRGSGHGV